MWPFRRDERARWVEEEFTPFDQGCRERFFLSAASFLRSNCNDTLSNGAYFEFGCHKARTMRYCWRHTRHWLNLRYYAFDSFEGLPEPSREDAHPGWERGAFAMSEEDFIKAVVGSGMPRDRLKTIRGFYKDTLHGRNLLEGATIIYVDCVLYSSAATVLKFIPKYLQLGTLIAFDDWNCYLSDPDKGERRAWREFLAENRNFRFEPFYSTHMLQAFVTVGT